MMSNSDAILDVDRPRNPQFDQRRERRVAMISWRIDVAVVDVEQRSGRQAQCARHSTARPQSRASGSRRSCERSLPLSRPRPCRSLEQSRLTVQHSDAARPLKSILLAEAVSPGAPRLENTAPPLSFAAQDPIIRSCSTNRKEVIRCRVISFTRTWPQRIALSGSSLPDRAHDARLVIPGSRRRVAPRTKHGRPPASTRSGGLFLWRTVNLIR